MSHQNGTAPGAVALTGAAQQMHNILARLQSTDNAARGIAENEFNTAMEQKGLCLDALSILAASVGVDEVVRAMAAVLLRRNAQDLWEGADTDAATQNNVKNRLLVGIRAEGRKDLRKKLCDTIAVIGAPLIDREPSQWPELLPTLFELGRSSIPYERESSLYIFSQLADFLDQKVFYPHLGTLKAAFHTGLSDTDTGVQMAGLRATCCLLNLLESHLCNEFVDLVPLMLRPVQQAITDGDEEDARQAIELLIDVVESEPKFWRRDLPAVCQLMLGVASNSSLSDETSPRQMALEFLVSVAEKLPSQCRKMGTFVRSVFPVGLQMMLEREDDPEWYEQEEEEDTSEYTLFDCGQESLDRIAIALGGKAVLPVAEAIIPSFLRNEGSWVHRHAALLAISQIGEGCQKQIEAKLGQVIDLALARFTDPHPRVRWAAINCIGQMCTDFGPRIQKEFHSSIVSHLIAVMDDAGNPRVQSHAAAAVINFCDEATPAVIAPYLDALLGKLQGLLHSPHRITQEQAVTAIAAVADSAETQFVKYYDWFMPRLKQVLSTAAGQKELRRLRGKVMECISLVGLSVGPEKFGPDAAEVMNVLVRTAATQTEDPDDPQGFYLMQAYARICRCLKAGFIQYLPHVMPGLLEAARQKPDIQVLEVKEDDENPDDQVDGYETVTIGDKRVGIRTSVLEDKAVACTMLACFIAELRGGFYDYVHPVTELMVPLLKFFYHDECRTAAANCLPDLVRCVMESGKDPTGSQVVQLVQFMMPQLLDAIKGEPDVEVLVHMVDALGEVGGLVHAPAFPQELMNSASQAISMILLESEARNIEREQQAEQEDWDEEAQEDAEAEEQKEEELLSRIASATGTLLRMHASAGFVQAFKTPYKLSEGSEAVSCMQIFWIRMQNSRPAYERQAALCVFDDLVLYGGAEAANIISGTLPAMKAYCLDPDADVRQAASFGVGVCAQVGGEAFLSSGGGQVVGDLERVIRDPVARSEAAESATDNAVSALLKIMEFQPSCMADNAASYGNLILDYLPAKADESEARVMHATIVRFVRAADPRIMGDNGSNMPKILSILLSVLGTPLIDEEYTRTAVEVIKGLQNKYPTELLQGAMAVLSNEQKQKLQAAISA